MKFPIDHFVQYGESYTKDLKPNMMLCCRLLRTSIKITSDIYIYRKMHIYSLTMKFAYAVIESETFTSYFLLFLFLQIKLKVRPPIRAAYMMLKHCVEFSVQKFIVMPILYCG